MLRGGLSKLDWDLLGKVRGGAWADAFDRKIAELVADCKAAPDVSEARKLTIEVSIKPITTEGEMTGLKTNVDFKTSQPKRGMTLICLPDSDAGVPCLVVNTENLNNPHQKPLFSKNEVDDESHAD